MSLKTKSPGVPSLVLILSQIVITQPFKSTPRRHTFLPLVLTALMMDQLGIIVLAIAIYCVGLLVYFYWQATRDRFYEMREERRRRRTFTTAGQFVPKSSQSDDEEESKPSNPRN